MHLFSMFRTWYISPTGVLSALVLAYPVEPEVTDNCDSMWHWIRT